MRLPCSRMFATAAAIFSLVLVLTGAAKVARPFDLQRALTSLGMPRIPGVGVAIGLIEVIVGVAALFAPSVLWAQAALYLAFAGWVVLALRSNVPLASCGCLGRADTPPSAAHVTLNLVAVIVSVGAAFGDPLAMESGIGLIAQLSVVAVGVFLAYVVLNDAAQLAGVRRT